MSLNRFCLLLPLLFGVRLAFSAPFSCPTASPPRRLRLDGFLSLGQTPIYQCSAVFFFFLASTSVTCSSLIVSQSRLSLTFKLANIGTEHILREAESPEIN